MKLNRFTVLIILSLYGCQETESLLSWLFGNSGNQPNRQDSATGTATDGKTQEHLSALNSRSSVPFEMTTSDEKFQLQAQFVKDLTPLDACHHRVIAMIGIRHFSWFWTGYGRGEGGGA